MNHASHHAEVLPFPSQSQQPRGAAYSSGYCDGLNDGEKWANRNNVWIGIAIGIVFASIVVIALLVYLGFFR